MRRRRFAGHVAFVLVGPAVATDGPPPVLGLIDLGSVDAAVYDVFAQGPAVWGMAPAPRPLTAGPQPYDGAAVAPRRRTPAVHLRPRTTTVVAVTPCSPPPQQLTPLEVAAPGFFGILGSRIFYISLAFGAGAAFAQSRRRGRTHRGSSQGGVGRASPTVLLRTRSATPRTSFGQLPRTTPRRSWGSRAATPKLELKHVAVVPVISSSSAFCPSGFCTSSGVATVPTSDVDTTDADGVPAGKPLTPRRRQQRIRPLTTHKRPFGQHLREPGSLSTCCSSDGSGDPSSTDTDDSARRFFHPEPRRAATVVKLGNGVTVASIPERSKPAVLPLPAEEATSAADRQTVQDLIAAVERRRLSGPEKPQASPRQPVGRLSAPVLSAPQSANRLPLRAEAARPTVPFKPEPWRF